VSEQVELHPGDIAPSIEAETATGEHFSLAALSGKWVVAYFYPRANTPG
jgi:thioredoxin-dependent peroxiredoxin